MKTIEEAACDYVNNKYKEFALLDIFGEETSIRDLSSDFIEGVKFAQRWIPVEEELPEKSKQVIVKLENGWHTCTWITEDGTFAFNVKPTHWRYIDLK